MQINWYRTSLILWTLARPGQGGRVTIGLVEGPCKISNSQEVTSSGDFFDDVGNNLRCANQVDEVREEQLDRGLGIKIKAMINIDHT